MRCYWWNACCQGKDWPNCHTPQGDGELGRRDILATSYDAMKWAPESFWMVLLQVTLSQ